MYIKFIIRSPIFHLLGTVHLPLEHTQGLESDGKIQFLDSVIQWKVFLVQIPIIIQIHNRFVILQTGSELDKLVQWGRNL